MSACGAVYIRQWALKPTRNEGEPGNLPWQKGIAGNIERLEETSSFGKSGRLPIRGIQSYLEEAISRVYSHQLLCHTGRFAVAFDLYRKLVADLNAFARSSSINYRCPRPDHVTRLYR